MLDEGSCSWVMGFVVVDWSFVVIGRGLVVFKRGILQLGEGSYSKWERALAVSARGVLQ